MPGRLFLTRDVAELAADDVKRGGACGWLV